MPLGLPEHFAEISPAATSGARILVISSPRPLEETALKSAFFQESVGRQFVLGVIPLTRLFLAHGQQDLLLESFLTVAVDNQIIIAPPEAAALVIGAWHPQYIVRLEIDDLSAVAYDALFLRILDFSGTIRAHYLNEKLEVVRTRSFVLSDTRYRQFGYGPELAYLLEKEIKKVLADILADRPPPQHYQPIPLAPEKVLLLLPPQLPPRIPPELGQQLADSYGFAKLPPLSSAQLSRVIQRGFTLAATGVSAATLASAPASDWWEGQWALLTVVEQISYEVQRREFSLRLRFHLRAQQHEMFQARCSKTFTAARAADAGAVVGLEQAAAELLEAFFTRNAEHCA